MRKDEEFAKQAFDQFLATKGISDRLWLEGNEPPDYFLVINNQRYAAEITTITERIDTPRKTVSRRTIDKSGEAFVRDVETTATKEGILNGTYYISFPFVQRDYYAVQKSLKLALLDFISRSKNDSEFPHTPIKIDGVQYCAIQKTQRPGSRIIVGINPSNAKWAGDAAIEACDLLLSSISEKEIKLAHINEQKILIILNEYPYIDSVAFYKSCLTTASQVENFHTIFLIDLEKTDNDCVLCTKNPNWQ
ncbi:MAG: hypothetical protein K8J31_21960 [Anaerolineae bacterium]|nr:hypothetical protein [Anaerolineae bacterium]